MSAPYSSIHGDKGGIFSKAAGWKPLFLLKTNIKQILEYPNKEYVIFAQINQNIRDLTRGKKNLHWT